MRLIDLSAPISFRFLKDIKAPSNNLDRRNQKKIHNSHLYSKENKSLELIIRHKVNQSIVEPLGFRIEVQRDCHPNICLIGRRNKILVP